jgi:hypothetical protein
MKKDRIQVKDILHHSMEKMTKINHLRKMLVIAIMMVSLFLSLDRVDISIVREII